MTNIMKILIFALALIIPGCTASPKLEKSTGMEVAASRKTTNELRLIQLESYINYELLKVEKYMQEAKPGAAVSVVAINYVLSADGDVSVTTTKAVVNGSPVGTLYIVSVYSEGKWEAIQMVAHAINSLGVDKRHEQEL